jgi:hypothetical protein
MEPAELLHSVHAEMPDGSSSVALLFLVCW